MNTLVTDGGLEVWDNSAGWIISVDLLCCNMNTLVASERGGLKVHGEGAGQTVLEYLHCLNVNILVSGGGGLKVCGDDDGQN